MDKMPTILVDNAGEDILSSNSTHPLDIKMDSNFAKLLFSLICGMAWVIYITYYNSRVTAYIVTRLLTRFYITKGYLSIGMCIIIIFDYEIGLNQI